MEQPASSELQTRTTGLGKNQPALRTSGVVLDLFILGLLNRYYVEVSKNRGTSKSSIYRWIFPIGKPIPLGAPLMDSPHRLEGVGIFSQGAAALRGPLVDTIAVELHEEEVQGSSVAVAIQRTLSVPSEPCA